MTYREEYQKWLNSGVLTDAEEDELLSLADAETELESRFYGPLEFGTAGLRGVMGLGLNRMNLYVIRHVTEAFARVILEEDPENASQGVAICFDCRNNSAEFAREAAWDFRSTVCGYAPHTGIVVCHSCISLHCGDQYYCQP